MKPIQRKLQSAILDDDQAGVDLALAKGADPNGVHEPFDRRPLHLAAGVSLGIAKSLLNAGADPLAEAKFGLSHVRADWMARAIGNSAVAPVLEEAVATALQSKDIGSGEKTLQLTPETRIPPRRSGP